MGDKEKKKSNESPFRNFFSGGFGGVCTVVSGHPLDTIKVRLQTMPQPAPGAQPMYTGTLDCAKKTIKHEGVRGLYKGMGAPLVGVTPIFAVSFFGFGCGKKLVRMGDENRELTKIDVMLAGFTAGVFTTTIMAPGERIKTLLQVQQGGGPQKYSGPIDVVRKLYKSGGLKSIFKGTVPTLLRDVPGSGVYFMSYEWLKDVLTSEGKSTEVEVLMRTTFSGGMAGILYWVVGTPADIIKSRLQSAPEGKYHGMKSVFNEVLKEGPLAFYRGVTPIMLRAFFANAACFIGYEYANQFFNWLDIGI